MKKILFFLGLLLFPLAGRGYDSTCFEFRQEISIFSGSTIRILTETQDLHAFQGGTLLPLKLTSAFRKEYFPYRVIGEGDDTALQDHNPITQYQFPQFAPQKMLSLHFSPPLQRKTFDYEIVGDFQRFEFEISKDGKNYTPISEALDTYDIEYLRLIFPQEQGVKNVSISELGFFKKNVLEFLVNPLQTGSILLYSGERCGDEELYRQENLLSQTASFVTNRETQSIRTQFENNPDFDVDWFQKYTKRDYDRDGVSDGSDNCPFHYNPRQTDSYGQGRGDECSDGDADGREGSLDNCMYITNPDQADINNNGIGDACEFDSDKDSIYDSVDNCIMQANVDQADADKDGIGTVCDNCDKYNPTQLDADSNGLGDECERPEETRDEDQDEIPDYKDNCPKVPNRDQLDTDGDGIGNLCDTCKDLKNPDQSDEDKNGVGDVCDDSDHDGFIGYRDNCISISNKDQLDANNNQIGDACEDDDGDRISNASDNCRYKANLDQRNVDGDALGDVCDDQDNRFLEQNRRVFVIIVLIVISLFGFGIFQMVRKIGKEE